MADPIPVNGQFIPLARQNELARTPSSYAITPHVGEDSSYQGESFYDVLNRTQLTSSQLKSMQAPNTTTAPVKMVPTTVNNPIPAGNPSSTTPAFSSGTSFTPAPGAPYSQHQIQETNEHLKNMPSVVPQDAAADNAILSNMQEYAAQKAATQAAQENVPPAVASTSVTEPAADVVDTAATQQVETDFSEGNQSVLSQPATPSPIPQADLNAIQAALTKNAVNSQTLQSKPVTADKPEAVPFAVTDTPILDPAVEPVSTNGFPAYIPAGKIAKQASNGKTQTVETTTPDENQVTSQVAQKSKIQNARHEKVKTDKTDDTQTDKTETSEKKGFPQAIGNFFGSIASAVTLGFYRPSDDPTPTGFARVIDPIKKVVWDAPKSIVVDAPAGIYNDITRYKETDESDTPTLAMTPQGKGARTIRDFGPNRTSVRKNYYS